MQNQKQVTLTSENTSYRSRYKTYTLTGLTMAFLSGQKERGKVSTNMLIHWYFVLSFRRILEQLHNLCFSVEFMREM